MREEREEMMGRLEEEEREQREADDKVIVRFLHKTLLHSVCVNLEVLISVR